MIHAKLPRAGLGNKLLIWANAYIYAHKNNKPIVTSGWFKIHIGPLLRNEKSKRFYWNYFLPASIFEILKLRLLYLFVKRIKNPSYDSIPEQNVLYIFDKVPHYSDYFLNLRENRLLIKKAFYAMISDKIKRKLDQYPAPLIAAHIRMGDFMELKPDENFKSSGLVRTPLCYFKTLFNSINELNDGKAAITIFTDGHENELKELTKIPNVSVFTSNIDIIDMMLISKAKIIITSAASTFSYWSAFVSDAVIIHHPDRNSTKIRSEEDKLNNYEGIFCKEVVKKVLSNL